MSVTLRCQVKLSSHTCEKDFHKENSGIAIKVRKAWRRTGHPLSAESQGKRTGHLPHLNFLHVFGMIFTKYPLILNVHSSDILVVSWLSHQDSQKQIWTQIAVYKARVTASGTRLLKCNYRFQPSPFQVRHLILLSD